MPVATSRQHVVAQQKYLLDRILDDLPPTASVTLMGDAEFRSIERFEYALDHGWDFCLGHKGDTLIFREDLDQWQPFKSLPVRPGKPCYLSSVWLTQQGAVGPVNLIAYWDAEDQCARYRITNRPANGYTLRWSRKRTWIEGLIRDYKSGGFQLDDTRIQHADRLDRLLLVMAVATWWFVGMATQVMKRGHRKQVDAEPKRARTYFQIGWRWLKQQARLERPIPFELLIYI